MTSLLRKVGLGLMVLMLTPAALAAGTAANTQLENTVTVNFDNLAGVAQTAVTSSVTITINLVQAAPTIAINSTSPADTTTGISEGQVVSVFYQVQSNANGPDSYEINFTEALTDLNGTSITEGTLAQTRNIGNLGASTVGVAAALDASVCLLPNAGQCSIELPNDNADFDGGDVNGLAVGDIVVLVSPTEGASLFCEVDAIDDSNEGSPYEPGTVASSISVDNCAADLLGTPFVPGDGFFNLAVGDDVLETAEFQVDFTMGTLTGATQGTTTVTAIADTDTGSNPSGAVNQLINVDPPSLEVTKYVRNVGTGQVGGGNTLTANGNTYYSTGITAAPTETLEYAIVVENTGGSGVQDVIITDPLVPFTTYVAVSAGLIDQGTGAGCPATCVVTTTGTFATVTDDTLETATDIGGDDSGTITIYAGVGGDEVFGGPGTGGTIAAGEVTVGFIQVTVD